ncbi:MAG: hypothetical protein HOD63_05310 [Bacteroidetes bacterium]|jgi:C4-type Zn-finger protein|nr:hypothetical protein [Bacteroidota bacterium]MBT5529340.1 hypothetical protein [Cytophagia bacterium]MBT3422748.1 hypothetical protein [Bacteroidota bacterium]MBT3800333.1 hypothetical protein [Bacteroidota bacterium]MBT3934071.1 hypothetical protein [Bacteroidota bacterium]
MVKKKEVSQRFVGQYKLECPVCNHDSFWTRETLMNTPGMTILGLDWANKTATNYVCDNCGYILWFAK